MRPTTPLRGSTPPQSTLTKKEFLRSSSPEKLERPLPEQPFIFVRVTKSIRVKVERPLPERPLIFIGDTWYLYAKIELRQPHATAFRSSDTSSLYAKKKWRQPLPRRLSFFANRGPAGLSSPGLEEDRRQPLARCLPSPPQPGDWVSLRKAKWRQPFPRRLSVSFDSWLGKEDRHWPGVCPLPQPGDTTLSPSDSGRKTATGQVSAPFLSQGDLVSFYVKKMRTVVRPSNDVRDIFSSLGLEEARSQPLARCLPHSPLPGDLVSLYVKQNEDSRSPGGCLSSPTEVLLVSSAVRQAAVKTFSSLHLIWWWRRKGRTAHS